MFIRWQKRTRKSPAFGMHYGRRGGISFREVEGRLQIPDVHWRAILVESCRVDGKPRQRHIAYLGGITESAIELHVPNQRGFFWNEVMDRLDKLDNHIDKDERTKIEATIAKRVPRLSEKEKKQANAGRARWISGPEIEFR